MTIELFFEFGEAIGISTLKRQACWTIRILVDKRFHPLFKQHRGTCFRFFAELIADLEFCAITATSHAK
jgi:hypothetical protein